VSFAAGVTSQTITVLVTGETVGEANETFFVNLTSPTGGATINDAQALGTIVNDDGAVLFSINDITAYEGHSGVKGFVFVVTLSAPSAQTCTVQFATADGTATVANVDYYATSGTLTFFAGQTTKAINVQVKGDRVGENDETFFVNLSNPTNAGVVDNQGLGTILNDDGPIPVPTIVVGPGTESSGRGSQARIGKQGQQDFATKDSSSPLAVSSTPHSKVATETTFGDLRFYVLESGDLKSESPEASSSNVVYSIDSSNRLSKVKV
jgi:hypothetical protein